MRKIIVLISVFCLLQSCVVSTAAKVVKTAGKVAVGAVKTTVNTIDWTVKKANGKINEDRLDGKWEVVGLFKGSYQDFERTTDPINIYESCGDGIELYEFNSKRSKFIQYSCGNVEPSSFKYKYSWAKDPLTGEKENMISYGPGYFNVINVDRQHLVLEEYFLEENGNKVRSIALLDKTK